MTSRSLHKLSAAEVAKLIKARKDGRYGDGGGLYLQINGGTPSWLYRYIRQGRERQMGLGPIHAVTLAQAREKAQKAREELAADRDPLVERAAAHLPRMTFGEVKAEFLAGYRPGLKNEKHQRQWGTTLDTYAAALDPLPVGTITTAHVLKVLKPIWQEIPETASRIRARLEKILDYATFKGWRSGDNPARWRGHLSNALLPVAKVREVRHMPALGHEKIPEFVAELRRASGVAARALEFLILTVARTADINGVPGREDKPPLRWSDVDLERRTWTIPRVKGHIEHMKPLSSRCIEILEEMKAFKLDPVIVFPSTDRPGHPLSASAMRSLLDRLEMQGEASAHGFRATFKTWAGEETSTPAEVIEASLAHGVIKDKVEAAYRRKDFFEKRRRLLEAWSSYAGGGGHGKLRIVA